MAFELSRGTRSGYAAAMARPTRFEHNRFLGDKRTQRVYDLDDPTTDAGLIDEIVAAGHGAAFGPDSLAEARNRNYKLARSTRTRWVKA